MTIIKANEILNYMYVVLIEITVYTVSLAFHVCVKFLLLMSAISLSQ